MRRPLRRVSLALAIVAACSLVATRTHAQISPYQKPYVVDPRQIDNVDTFLFNKYFYRNPAVSPYVNLSRRGTPVGDAYTSFVRPEMQRREQAAQSQRTYIQQRKLSGNVGHTYYGGPPRNPNARPNTSRMPASLTPYYGQQYQRR